MSERLKIFLLCLAVVILLVTVSRWRNQHHDPRDKSQSEMGANDYP